jgi:tagatose 1,6-diphosphate aldolase
VFSSPYILGRNAKPSFCQVRGVVSFQITAGKYRGLSRIADPDGLLMMTAVSHRPALEKFVAQRNPDGAFSYQRIGELKEIILAEWSRHSSSVMVDLEYAYPFSAKRLNPRAGLVVAVERGDYEAVPCGGRKNHLYTPDVAAKVKRLGADGVNISIYYRPDASREVLHHQHSLVERLGAECRRLDIPFFLSPLQYPLTDSETTATDDGNILLETIAEFRKERYGVDVFQLENPLSPECLVDPDVVSGEQEKTQRFYDALGAMLDRPWVMLSAGSSLDIFRRTLTYAFRAGACGYLAGRAFWGPQAESYPDLSKVAARIREEVQSLLRKRGTPWTYKFDPAGNVEIAQAGATFLYDYSA